MVKSDPTVWAEAKRTIMPAVCILGGGYAGLRVARDLSARLGPEWTLTLIDRSDCHQLISRLPEVVAGKIRPHDACIPFERVIGRRVRHLSSQIQRVDSATRTVETSAGPMRPDVLVIALGTTPDFLDIPGASEFAMTVKSVSDAVRIRDRIADLRSQQSVVRVVIIGAGYTGTEVAGELCAPGPDRHSDKAWGRVDVRIVAEDERLLPQASAQLGAAVERVLRGRNIPIHLGQPVGRVESHGLTTVHGNWFPADLVVWAGQTHVASDVFHSFGRDVPTGKLRVDPYLQVSGTDSTFACGDAAMVIDYVRGSVAPSSAQLAVQEGETVARNIAARAQGRPLTEYRPRILGEALSFGAGSAVAEVGGLLLSGRAAAAVKRAALVRYLAGLSTPSMAW
jgi:NADH:ubiquinone reductase (H+-translocating)